MDIKYLYYDNNDGSILSYDIITTAEPEGYYLEDQKVDDDFDMDYFEVVDISGTMTLQEKSQSEKDAVDAARVTEDNATDRKSETLLLSYDFYETIYKDWDNMDSGFKTVLAAWKTAMDQIWTDHPE